MDIKVIDSNTILVSYTRLFGTELDFNQAFMLYNNLRILLLEYTKKEDFTIKLELSNSNKSKVRYYIETKDADVISKYLLSNGTILRKEANKKLRVDDIYVHPYIALEKQKAIQRELKRRTPKKIMKRNLV